MTKRKRAKRVNFLPNQVHYRKIQLLFLIQTYLTGNWR